MGMQVSVIGALFLSVASSVSIVICNKALMSNLGFPFATTLTSWHLMVTYCTLHVAHRFNLFENKPMDAKTVMLFGLLNGVSIGLLNLSLGFNSIGFYQMTKLAIIPFTVLLETLFLKKQFRLVATHHFSNFTNLMIFYLKKSVTHLHVLSFAARRSSCHY